MEQEEIVRSGGDAGNKIVKKQRQKKAQNTIARFEAL